MILARRPTLMILPLAGLVVAVAMLTNVVPFRQIVAQQEAVRRSQSHLAQLQEENRQLEQQVEALHTPQEVERLARQQLGYVMPGEVAFVVVEPETVPIPLAEAAPTEPAAPVERPWYQALWDFLTGRDLAPKR